ncbi:MAG: hypothetical protein ACLGH0_09205, partial [Thermoanaerobaculia bacterium]
AHLASCEDCRGELAKLANVLDRVTPVEVPEPDHGFEARTWDRVAWKLRGANGAAGSQPARFDGLRAHRSIAAWLAAAAMLAVAFLAGIFATRDNAPRTEQVATTTTTPATTTQPVATTQQQRDRILLVVVGDHFDESERVLVELTNLTPSGNTDITNEREQAEELLASNRLYRRTALDRGEEQVATLLDELEPVLLQIAHAPSQVSDSELRRLQKRVEAKGLVFKLRVVRADVRKTYQPNV